MELACHPYPDTTLLGRDCTEHDGLFQSCVDELHLLNQPSFFDACVCAGFTCVSPAELLGHRAGRFADAA